MQSGSKCVVLENPLRLSPEVVDNTLKVSGDQHHQGDHCGEDQGWRWSQSVDMSHGQNVWLQKEQKWVRLCDNHLNTERSNIYSEGTVIFTM